MRSQPGQQEAEHRLLLRLVVRLVPEIVPQLEGAVAARSAGELAAGRRRGDAVRASMHQQQREGKLGGMLQRPAAGVEHVNRQAGRDAVVDEWIVHVCARHGRIARQVPGVDLVG